MPEIVIQIPIVPKPQRRARSRIAGSGPRQFVQVYTSAEQRSENEKFRALLYRELPPGFQPIQSAVRIWIFARFPIPKCSKKKYAQYLGLEIRHTKAPDCDNLAKYVMDCCKGVVWLDDKQVTRLTVGKAYSPNPEWEIRLEW